MALVYDWFFFRKTNISTCSGVISDLFCLLIPFFLYYSLWHLTQTHTHRLTPSLTHTPTQTHTHSLSHSLGFTNLKKKTIDMRIKFPGCSLHIYSYTHTAHLHFFSQWKLVYLVALQMKSCRFMFVVLEVVYGTMTLHSLHTVLVLSVTPLPSLSLLIGKPKYCLTNYLYPIGASSISTSFDSIVRRSED